MKEKRELKSMASKKKKDIPKVDFDVDVYCNEAISICNNIVTSKMDFSKKSLNAMEIVIQEIRKSNKSGFVPKENIWPIAVFFGTYVGETMLRTGLKDRGFKWEINEEGIPIIADENNAASPITKIYKKMQDNSKGDDNEGDLLSFYNIFVAMLEYNNKQTKRKNEGKKNIVDFDGKYELKSRKDKKSTIGAKKKSINKNNNKK